MEKHLKDCSKVGADVRKQIDQKLKRPATSPEESPFHKKAKLSMSDTSISSHAGTGTLKNWFDSTSKDDQDELDILLTRAFTTGNIAPNFLDNPFFKQFVAKLRPSYKLPGRQHKFAKVLIPAEFERKKWKKQQTRLTFSQVSNLGSEKDATLKDEASRLKQILLTEDFWLYVNHVRAILCPLVEAITAIEGNEVDSRSCYMKIREVFASSKAAISNSEFLPELKEELMEILNGREEFGKTDVAHLLDVLEPSDQGQSLNQQQKQAAIELLAKKFLKNPVFAGQEKQVLTEWAHWLAGTSIFARDKRRYAWDAVDSMDALTWWTAFFSDTLVCKVVQMLHNVPISAAPTERNWSLRSGIHTKLRNRMNVDTASQVTFIKHNLMLEHADLFKPPRKEQQMEELEETIEETNEDTNIFDEEFGDLFDFD